MKIPIMYSCFMPLTENVKYKNSTCNQSINIFYNVLEALYYSQENDFSLSSTISINSTCLLRNPETFEYNVPTKDWKNFFAKVTEDFKFGLSGNKTHNQCSVNTDQNKRSVNNTPRGFRVSYWLLYMIIPKA